MSYPLPLTPESIVIQLARLDLASVLVMAKLHLSSCEAVLGIVHPSSENVLYSYRIINVFASGVLLQKLLAVLHHLWFMHCIAFLDSMSSETSGLKSLA